MILLENNFLSSPERLFELKKILFQKNLTSLNFKKFIFLENNEQSKNNKIIISKLNLNLKDFSQKKFNINLNRVAFIFIVIFFCNFIFN